MCVCECLSVCVCMNVRECVCVSLCVCECVSQLKLITLLERVLNMQFFFLVSVCVCV